MDKVKILFLSADPSDSTRLRLGQELRDIRENLQLSKQRDKFSLESRESVRPKDITQAIFDIEPQIIHFSGHGMSTGELCFEDGLGKAKPVQPDALANLFELVAEHVRCVILNACYSETQAKLIVEHIPFVLGMDQAIADRAAITFAVGFYKALAAGRSFEDAYKFARVEIQLEGIPEHLTPVLHVKENAAGTESSSKRCKYVVILSATIDEINKPLVEAMVAHLRQVSGDTSLTLQRVEAGSVRLILEGSDEGFWRLEELFETEQLVDVMGIPVQDIQSEQEKFQPYESFAHQLSERWRLHLEIAIPEYDSEACNSIVSWLLGKDLSSLNDLTPTQRKIVEKAVEYRYRILRQRYLGIPPEQAYERLIQRLSSLFLIRNKVRTWITLSRDRQHSVTDVLQEVVQELLRNDTYMQQQMLWIVQCTDNPHLRNSLLLTTTEEYCLRPIRNQPLLSYRFVSYVRQSQRNHPARDFIRLVSEELISSNPEDVETIVSLIDAQAITSYHQGSQIREGEELYSLVQQQFEVLLNQNVGAEAVEWLKLYLQGYSRESIAQTLDIPIKQVYRLREKIIYHAIRVFASQPHLRSVIDLEDFSVPNR